MNNPVPGRRHEPLIMRDKYLKPAEELAEYLQPLGATERDTPVRSCQVANQNNLMKNSHPPCGRAGHQKLAGQPHNALCPIKGD